MRRLMIVLGVVVGVVVVRRWRIEQSERELGLAGGGPA
jgi:hypothetical protein